MSKSNRYDKNRAKKGQHNLLRARDVLAKLVETTGDDDDDGSNKYASQVRMSTVKIMSAGSGDHMCLFTNEKIGNRNHNHTIPATT
jgi:hypothetical protein